MDDALSFMRNVYKGKYKQDGSIDRKRTNQYAKAFSDAVNKGWQEAGGKIVLDFDTPDGKMLAALRNNIFHFSAAKNRAEIVELSSLLRDDKGKLRTWNSFQDAASKVVEAQQVRYLRVEYDIAVNSSYLAARWQEFDDDDILVFRTAGDARVRESHRALDGTSLPKTHRFWDSFYPPLAWNCRCTVETTLSGRQTPDAHIPWGEIDKVPPIFRSNFAKEGLAFPKEHPYYKVDYLDKKGKLRQLDDVRKDVLKTYDNGGRIIASKMVDKSTDDYQKVFDSCLHFAVKGNKVEILPKIHKDNVAYDYFFKELKGTTYASKCPDFKVGDLYYEHEGFLPNSNPQNRLSNMLNRGIKQSSRIVVNYENSTLNYIKRIIKNRIIDGQIIDEVWLLMPDKTLIKVY